MELRYLTGPLLVLALALVVLAAVAPRTPEERASRERRQEQDRRMREAVCEGDEWARSAQC